MLKKITAGLLIMATASFGMSLGELNKASKDELMQINGIGEVKASSIIKERRKGKFKSFDGLSSRVDGVGEQIAANVKNDIKVGETPKAVSKKATKSTRTKATSKTEKMTDTTKDMKSKTSKSKSKADKKTKEMTKKKDRKIKSMDDKKKELKTKSRKTRTKTKTKAKKTKKKMKTKK